MTLRVRQLSYQYGEIQALRDVSAEATPGKITAILGPNAAGKSTLLRCIIGALRPTSGDVLINGTPVHRIKTTELASRIAYVPQRSHVAAAFSVREVVELGRYALPVDHTRVDDALELLELTELEDRPYPALSVGQQQRVTLARALAQLEPPCPLGAILAPRKSGDETPVPRTARSSHLILDEPMSAMDLRHVRDSIALLRGLADHGVTVLIAMHDLSLAASAAHEAWLLAQGRLVASGNICDVLDVERLASVFDVRFQWLDRECQVGGPWLVADSPRP